MRIYYPKLFPARGVMLYCLASFFMLLLERGENLVTIHGGEFTQLFRDNVCCEAAQGRLLHLPRVEL